MTQGYIRTIEDMERLYYGAGAGTNAWAYSGTDLLKADSPLMSSTSGTYKRSRTQGLVATQPRVQRILNPSKEALEKSGWRVVSGKPDDAVGLPENGTLPDSTKPTFEEVNEAQDGCFQFDSAKPMFLATRMMDSRQEQLSKWKCPSPAESINKMLLKDVNTAAGNTFESTDRALSSSKIELASFADISALSKHNMYSITRNTGSGTRAWFDANVSAGTGGAERPLTLNTLDGMFREVWERGGSQRLSSQDMTPSRRFNNSCSLNNVSPR